MPKGIWNHIRNAQNVEAKIKKDAEEAAREEAEAGATALPGGTPSDRKDESLVVTEAVGQPKAKEVKDIDITAVPLIGGVGDPKYNPLYSENQLARPKDAPDINRVLDKDMLDPNTEDPYQPLVDQKMKEGITLPDGSISYSEQDARKAVMAELENQYERRMKINEDSFTWESLDVEDAQKKLNLNSDHMRDSVSSLVNNSARLDDQLNMVISPLLSSTIESDMRVSNILMTHGLVDPTTKQLSPRVANALAITLTEVIQDEINKRDTKIQGKYNEAYQEGSSIKFTDDTLNREKVEGNQINPDYLKGTLIKSALAKVLPTQDPNLEGTKIVTGNNPEVNKLFDPEAIAILDTLAWQAIKQHGFIEETRRQDAQGNPLEKYYKFSYAADNYYNSTRDVLSALQPDRRIDVSLTPTTGGRSLQGFGRLNQKDQPYSLKSMMDQNIALENIVKNNLGGIPFKINEDGLKVATKMVSSVIDVDPKTGMINGLFEQGGDGFYSTNRFAAAINLDKAKWEKSYVRALNRLNADKEGLAPEESQMRHLEAMNQADKVMRQEARKILQTLKDAQDKTGQVFYNKWFHATSVGRYFIRNTVLNPMDSKLVRMIVTSPKRNDVDLNTVTHKSVGNDKEPNSKATKMENWVYILGKNLLTPNETNGVDTEDMGWNAILRITRSILDTKGKGGSVEANVYNRWKEAGIGFKKFSQDPLTNIEQIIDNSGTESSFAKNDEWGFKHQAFIDFANYHEAMEKKEKGLSAIFNPKARAQHDGKQSGIAIQAMQKADLGFLKRTGVIYKEGDDSNVIPEGDVRSLFMSNLLNRGIEQTFRRDPAKLGMYSGFFAELIANKDNKYPNLAKELSKTPLMEVSYGKSPMFNQETVINFLNKREYQDVLLKHFNMSGIDEKIYSKKADIVADLNDLIMNSLNLTLDFEEQTTLKNVGLLWSMLGITPNYQGPLGTNIFLGGTEIVDSDVKVTIPMPSGERIERTIKKAIPSGSRRTSKQKLQYDEVIEEFTRGARSRFGQEVANQIPVLGVQHIDAAIMAKTINEVNKGKFLIPVHDSIITDIDGVREYHRSINKNFVEVNKTYNIPRAVRNGYTRAYLDFRKNIQDNSTYLLTSDDTATTKNSPHRALHSYIKAKYDSMTAEERFDRKPLNNRTPKQTNIQRFILDCKKQGWKPEGGTVSGYQLKNLLARVASDLDATYQKLTDWERASREGQAIVARKMFGSQNLIYQYN